MEPGPCANVYWKLVSPSTPSRMNLIENTKVSKAFFESEMLDYIGVVQSENLRLAIFNEREWQSFCWNWTTFQLGYHHDVHIFKFKNKQRLPKMASGRVSFDYEVWIFGMFLGSNDRYYMCPLRQESEFVHDVFEVLANLARQDNHK